MKCLVMAPARGALSSAVRPPMSPTVVAIVFVVGLAFAWAIRLERKRRAALLVYWSRGCAGRAWRTAFPEAPKDEIREFLYIVVDAFGFKKSQALQLAPTDTVQGLYRACYPDPSAPDAMELETLERSLLKRVGVAKLVGLPESVTFGELFSRITVERPNTSLERSREP